MGNYFQVQVVSSRLLVRYWAGVDLWEQSWTPPPMLSLSASKASALIRSRCGLKACLWSTISCRFLNVSLSLLLIIPLFTLLLSLAEQSISPPGLFLLRSIHCILSPTLPPGFNSTVNTSPPDKGNGDGNSSDGDKDPNATLKFFCLLIVTKRHTAYSIGHRCSIFQALHLFNV